MYFMKYKFIYLVIRRFDNKIKYISKNIYLENF